MLRTQPTEPLSSLSPHLTPPHCFLFFLCSLSLFFDNNKNKTITRDQKKKEIRLRRYDTAQRWSQQGCCLLTRSAKTNEEGRLSLFLASIRLSTRRGGTELTMCIFFYKPTWFTQVSTLPKSFHNKN